MIARDHVKSLKEHLAEADRLLARDDLAEIGIALPQAHIQAAIAHALAVPLGRAEEYAEE